jgi:hypothetical protein
MKPMRGIPYRRIQVLLVLLLLCLAGCLSDGGGSDTETLTGLVRLSDGSPAAGAEVKLIPAEYNPSQPLPVTLRTARTDAQGRYRLAHTDAGAGATFNLIATSPGVGQALYLGGLSKDSVPATLTLEKARTLFISLHGDTYQTSDSGKAWIPGTDYFVRCEVAQAGTMTLVPRGINDLVIESRAGWRHDYVVTNPGDSLVIKATRNEVLCQPY